MEIYFRVTSVEPDPLHPTRPKMNIIGEVDGKFNAVGFVKLTDDDQVWWHYVSNTPSPIVRTRSNSCAFSFKIRVEATMTKWCGGKSVP